VSRDRREEAAEHARKGRWAKAIDAYRALLSELPDDPIIRAELADVYLRSKNIDKAFHHFNRAAAIYQQHGDMPGALQMLIFANSVSPNEPDILYRMADCLRILGRIQELDAVLIQLVKVATAPGDRRRVRALDELFALHPDDFGVAQQRAEALGEAGRVDEAVAAYKQLAGRLVGHDVEFIRVIQRAAEIATPERVDLGIDLAGVLLGQAKPREALALLVPYYEKFPDDVGVLAALVGALDGMGARDKVIPARIELIKARAKREQKAETLAEIEELLRIAPDDASALEVSAHAYMVFKEPAKAAEVWRRLAHGCDKRGQRLERDRAVLQLLKTNPDDEEALDLGARALEEAGRNTEAAALRQRLVEVRALKRRSASPERKPEAPKARPTPARTAAVDSEPMPIARAPTEPGPEELGTVMLGESDVVDMRSSPKATRAPGTSSRPDEPNKSAVHTPNKAAPRHSSSPKLRPSAPPPSGSTPPRAKGPLPREASLPPNALSTPGGRSPATQPPVNAPSGSAPGGPLGAYRMSARGAERVPSALGAGSPPATAARTSSSPPDPVPSPREGTRAPVGAGAKMANRPPERPERGSRFRQESGLPQEVVTSPYPIEHSIPKEALRTYGGEDEAELGTAKHEAVSGGSFPPPGGTITAPYPAIADIPPASTTASGPLPFTPPPNASTDPEAKPPESAAPPRARTASGVRKPLAKPPRKRSSTSAKSPLRPVPPAPSKSGEIRRRSVVRPAPSVAKAKLDLDAIDIQPTLGPVLDPFFDEVPTHDPRRSAVPERYRAALPDDVPELDDDDVPPTFRPEEVTSKMQALVEEELLQMRELTGATDPRAQAQRSGDTSGGFEISEDTESPGADAAQATSTNMPLVADLLEELPRPERQPLRNGRPTKKRRP
jgi:tetratricopeptide (TPR) repeat protein